MQVGRWPTVLLQLSEDKVLKILKTDSDNYKTALYTKTKHVMVCLYVRHDEKVAVHLFTCWPLQHERVCEWVTWSDVDEDWLS